MSFKAWRAWRALNTISHVQFEPKKLNIQVQIVQTHFMPSIALNDYSCSARNLAKEARTSGVDELSLWDVSDLCSGSGFN